MKLSATLLITLSHGLSNAFANEDYDKDTFTTEAETPSSSDDSIALASTYTEELYSSVTSSFSTSGTVKTSCYFTTTCDEEGTTVIKTVDCSETSIPASSTYSSEVSHTSIPSISSSCYFTTTCDEEGTLVTKIIECPQTSKTTIPSSKVTHTSIPSSEVSYTSIPSISTSCYFTTTCDEEGTPVTKIVECPRTSETPIPSSKASTTEIPTPSSKVPTTEIPIPSSKVPTTEIPIPPSKVPTTEILSPSTEVPTSEIPVPSTEVPTTEIPAPSTEVPTTEIPIPSPKVPTTEIPIPSTKVPTTEIPIPSTIFPIPANFTTPVLPTTAFTEISITKNQTHSIITFEGVANDNSRGINAYIFGLLPLLLI